MNNSTMEKINVINGIVRDSHYGLIKAYSLHNEGDFFSIVNALNDALESMYYQELEGGKKSILYILIDVIAEIRDYVRFYNQYKSIMENYSPSDIINHDFPMMLKIRIMNQSDYAIQYFKTNIIKKEY